MKNLLLSMLCEDDGATAVEYAVMLAMILLAVIGTIGLFGQEAGTSFNQSSDKIDEAFSASGL